MVKRVLPIIEDEELQRKMIVCIHNYRGPLSVHARKLHYNSEAIVKILYGHEFKNIYMTLKMQIKDCLICIMVHMQVPSHP